MEGNDTSTPAEKAAAIGALLTNGQYVIDYKKGMVWGKKATTTATMTAVSYKISVVASSTSGIVPDSNVTSSSGGGSAGGGNNTYSTEQGDFTAAVTNATTNIVLSVDSIGGVALNKNNFANGILKVWDASTEEMITITLDDFTWTAGTKTLAVANCTGAFTFATGDIVSLTIVGSDKGYDKLNNAQYNNPIRGQEDQYASESTVLTNIATNTTGYIYIETNGYRIPTVQCITSGTAPTDTLTLTLEATVQDDGTALSSCTFSDITEWMTDLITGATSAASFVDVNCVLASTMPLAVKGLRLKYVTSNGGGGDADLTVHVKKMF